MYKLLLISTILFACTQTESSENKSENTDKRAKSIHIDEVFDMPEQLNEISGIAFINDSTIACVQDEIGTLYIYSLKSKKIIKEIEFAKAGDYEDITIKNNAIAIVNSAGTIYEISNYNSENFQVQKIKTALKKENDIESIYYLKNNNTYLIGIKGKTFEEEKNIKEIYAYDLNTKQLKEQPVFKIDIKEIENYFKSDAVEESAKKLLKNLGNKNMEHVFHISSLTVNPSNNDILLLSSLNNLVLTISTDGKLKDVYKLKGKEFKQPEGIAYAPSGDLYISNENRGKGNGNIIKVKYENE